MNPLPAVDSSSITAFQRNGHCTYIRDVTQTSSCWVNTTILFFVYFPMKVARGHTHSSWGKSPNPRLSMTAPIHMRGSSNFCQISRSSRWISIIYSENNLIEILFITLIKTWVHTFLILPGWQRWTNLLAHYDQGINFPEQEISVFSRGIQYSLTCVKQKKITKKDNLHCKVAHLNISNNTAFNLQKTINFKHYFTLSFLLLFCTFLSFPPEAFLSHFLENKIIITKKI